MSTSTSPHSFTSTVAVRPSLHGRGRRGRKTSFHHLQFRQSTPIEPPPPPPPPHNLVHQPSTGSTSLTSPWTSGYYATTETAPQVAALSQAVAYNPSLWSYRAAAALQACAAQQLAASAASGSEQPRIPALFQSQFNQSDNERPTSLLTVNHPYHLLAAAAAMATSQMVELQRASQLMSTDGTFSR